MAVTFSEQPLFWRMSYFFMARTSIQHQTLQKRYFFNKAAFTIEVPFSVVSFSEKLLFGSSQFFRKSIYCSNCFLGKLIYQNEYFFKRATLLQHTCLEVVICCYTSFPQVLFLFQEYSTVCSTPENILPLPAFLQQHVLSFLHPKYLT